MKKFFYLIFLCASTLLKADEGMWVLSLIDKKYEDLKKQGFKLSPEDIYNINKASLKDAIVGFGTYDNPLSFFCSGSIISNKGLVITNHHCGYSYIQKHSTLEHNYLRDGFWAKNINEELPNDKLCVSILLQIIDVTNQIITPDLDTINDLNYNNQIIQNRINQVLSPYSDEPYFTIVSRMFEGNQYLLFLYETYYDVRLVGAPPSDIGKFGGDTDNWMWPRHTGDFCLFRIYVSPDSKPAKYHKDNVPFMPKKYLKINSQGVEIDDYAMILGFPAATNRYYTSYEVKNVMNITAPYTIKIREKKLDVINKQMKNSEKIKLQYAAKYSECSNYYKYYIGQLEQLKRNKVLEKKENQEKIFLEWIKQDSSRLKKYQWILPYIEEHYNKNYNFYKIFLFFNEALFQGSELVLFPMLIFPYLDEINLVPKDSLYLVKEKLLGVVNDFYKDFDVETDKQLFINLMQIYTKEIPEDYQLSFISEVKKKYKFDFKKYADNLYKTSIFSDKNRLLNIINNLTEKNISKIYNDVFFGILQEASFWYMFNPLSSDSLYEAKRLWVKAQKEMYSDSIFYPDANGTIRLTYGKVKDYFPRNAIRYEYYTTLDGIIEKEDPNNEEFKVPEKLKKLYETKNFGNYAKNNTIPVCFITNTDITGGNSGSGVLDAYGNLIGIAFDGNWEAMSGDIFYEPSLQRTICVDIRYVLFIIEKFAEAKNLMSELNVN